MSWKDIIKRNKANEKKEREYTEFFKMMNAYQPIFSSFEGGVYEYELTRASIHCFAKNVSKLKPELTGKTAGALAWQKQLQFCMNPLQNTSQYLYHLATLYKIHNTAFIAPVYKNEFYEISGFIPITPANVQLVNLDGKNYYKYLLQQGTYLIEVEKAGIINSYLHKSYTFGDSNNVLQPTINLLETNKQGIIEGVKNSANIRFMGKLAHVMDKEDIIQNQKMLREINLNSNNNNGIFAYDTTFSDMKQIQSQQFVANSAQQREIEDNVFTYMGTNKKILQSDYDDDAWNSYFEGEIEPFAIQASLSHTLMTYSENEIAFGNSIIFTTNRLQHMSIEKRVNVGTSLFDRGIANGDMVADMFNLPKPPNGDKFFIRKEYLDMAEIQTAEVTEDE